MKCFGFSCFFGCSSFFQNYILLILVASAAANPVIISDATTHKNFGEFSDSNEFHFQTLTLLKHWGDTQNILLIGSLNYVYMLDPSTKASNRLLPYSRRLQWVADQSGRETCKLILRPENECHNYIKVVQKLNNGTLYVCGTNAHKPSCRYYTKKQFHSSNSKDSVPYLEDTCLGPCGVSNTPQVSTMLLYAKTSQEYRRVVAMDGEIIGRNTYDLTGKGLPEIFSDESWFNDANFVKIVKYQNKAYLFFRETATSVETGNRPIVYGRVAQVCLNDAGAEKILRNKWITFLKARLKCSLPSPEEDQNELTLNNLVSVSDVVDVAIDDKIIKAVFAIFTTPKSWSFLSSSAICMFTMKSIQNLFKTGDFYGEKEVTPEISVKFRVEDSIPNPRPGTCLGPGANRPPSALHFIQTHILMYDSIPAFQKAPIFVSDSNSELTKVTVDSKAGNSNGLIIYVSTNDGRIFRIRPTLGGTFESKKVRNRSKLLEQMRIMEKSKCKEGFCTVHALQLYKPENNNKRPFVFVAFDDRVIRTPLSICEKYSVKSCCSVDPECGWKSGECVERINENLPLPNVEDSKKVLKLCLKETGGGSENDEEDFGSASLDRFVGALIALVLVIVLVSVVKREKIKKMISKPVRQSASETEQGEALTPPDYEADLCMFISCVPETL